MFFLKFFSAVATLTLVLSCSSGGLQVDSNPVGAEVFILRKGSTPSAIGKTPLTLNKESVPDLYDNQTSILVDKQGFEKQTILIPKASVMAKGQLHVVLKAKEIPIDREAENREEREAANITELASGIARSQQLMMRKELAEAEILLINISNKFPNIYVTYDLLGNISYLRKDLPKALLYYKRSLNIWPNNPETRKLYERLKLINSSGLEGSRGSQRRSL